MHSRNDAMADHRLFRHYPTRRLLVWTVALAAVLLCGALMARAHSQTGADPRLQFPRIQASGGVLTVGPGALAPSPHAVHRLLVDVDDDTLNEHGISPRLKAAAKILNLYALAGVPPEKVQLTLLFYGRGVHLALSDRAYRARYHQPNPEAELLAQLRRAHVRMIACGQALGHQTLTADDVRPGVEVALSALTAREELLAAGYGSVPREAP